MQVAKPMGSKGEDREDQVYSITDERTDWATVWTALRQFRTFTSSRMYGGLAASHKRTDEALDALKRLNDHRATQ